jgi:hypothetical protein
MRLSCNTLHTFGNPVIGLVLAMPSGQIQNLIMVPEMPRRYPAVYASTLLNEIRKSFHLDPDEEIHFVANVQRRRNWLARQPGMVALTQRRLIFLEHFLFTRDSILELPRSALVNVSEDLDHSGRWLRIVYTVGGSPDILTLRPVAYRGSPSISEVASLVACLRFFYSGDLSAFLIKKASP